MPNIQAYENFFVMQQLLVTGVIVAGFIFGAIYFIHRIALENRAVDNANKDVDKKETTKSVSKPIVQKNEKSAEIDKQKKAWREEILARYKTNPETKTENETAAKEVPKDGDSKKMVETAVAAASVFGDTTVAKNDEEGKTEEKPSNVVAAEEKKPANVVKKPKVNKPKVDMFGEL